MICGSRIWRTMHPSIPRHYRAVFFSGLSLLLPMILMLSPTAVHSPSLIINLDGVKSRAVLMLLLAFLGGGNTVAAAQAPPAVAPSPHLVKRVLLLSVDGLHALDLANYVKARPNSSLAQLSQHGFTYTNARTSLP